MLPSPTLIITIENWEYMTTMKEKLLGIKEIYRNLRLSPITS